MDHTVTVTVLDGFQKLVYEAAHLVKFDSIGIFFEYFEQVFVQILEHEVQAVASVNKNISYKQICLN